MINASLVNGNENALNKIIPALLAAKRDFEPIVKNRVNPSYNSSYADLGAIEDALSPSLNKRSLVIQQLIQIEERDDGRVIIKIETLLWHRSGQYLSSLFTIPYEGNKSPHSIGSFITYFRRYSLLGFLGLATHDNLDDDGNRSQSDFENRSDVHPPRLDAHHPPKLSVQDTVDKMKKREDGASSERPSADLAKPLLPASSNETPTQTENVQPSLDKPEADTPKLCVLQEAILSDSFLKDVTLFSSLIDQLPNQKRDKLIKWCREKQYHSGTEFIFDSIPPDTLKMLIKRCQVAIDENTELDTLRQEISEYAANKGVDIQALGKNVGVENATSVFDFDLEQLQKLKKLCKEKLINAWNIAKAVANSKFDNRLEPQSLSVDNGVDMTNNQLDPQSSSTDSGVDVTDNQLGPQSSTINQTQKEEIELLWSESGFSTGLLFNFLSRHYNVKIESWYHIPSEHFDDICLNLPNISEEITNNDYLKAKGYFY
ncbi:MAG: ERF family protein [Pseudomonadota bacterium]